MEYNRNNTERISTNDVNAHVLTANINKIPKGEKLKISEEFFNEIIKKCKIAK